MDLTCTQHKQSRSRWVASAQVLSKQHDALASVFTLFNPPIHTSRVGVEASTAVCAGGSTCSDAHDQHLARLRECMLCLNNSPKQFQSLSAIFNDKTQINHDWKTGILIPFNNSSLSNFELCLSNLSET